MRTSRFTTRRIMTAIAFIVSPWLALAGSLTPPGPPAPTMKTLTEVQPRTPISSLPFTISQPGSYYLTQNHVLAPGVCCNGISVVANNVVLDLNGFEMSGVGSLLGSAGVALGSSNNSIVRNGTIRGFTGSGITSAGGNPPPVFNLIVEDVIVSDCGTTGFAYSGIYLVRGIVRGSIVRGNKQAGITVLFDGLVEDCIADGNGNYGIEAGTGTTVRDCTVRHNGSAGIAIGDRTMIVGNNVSDNVGSGIFTYGGSDNRIEGNNVVSNQRFGIECSTTGNFVVKNSSRSNSFGPWLLLLGNVAPSEVGTATNAWSNVAF